MARPRMRPSFRVAADCSAATLHDTIERQLTSAAEDVVGDLSARNVFLRIPEARRRFWTPCLELTIEDCSAAGKTEEGARTRLWGTFSPRAEIWTAFVFAIGTLVIVSVFTGVYGIAQLVLGRPPVALLVPIGGVFAGLLMYLSALVGQGMSISEMYRLRAFVDDCLREAEEAEARTPPRIKGDRRHAAER